MTIKLYSKPNCQPCRLTKMALDKAGLEYVEIDIEDHIDMLKARGHMQAPVVIAGSLEWSGFRPDMIKELV